MSHVPRGVSTATVSAVINDFAYVSPELRARVLAAIKNLATRRRSSARNLKRGRSQLIALVVADLANPFFARVVWAAEAAVAAWGYSLVVFNSDEKPEAERRILSRIRMLSCDGVMLVPVGDSDAASAARSRRQADPDGAVRPHRRGRQVGHRHHRQYLGRPAGDRLSARPRPHAASAPSPARCT